MRTYGATVIELIVIAARVLAKAVLRTYGATAIELVVIAAMVLAKAVLRTCGTTAIELVVIAAQVLDIEGLQTHRAAAIELVVIAARVLAKAGLRTHRATVIKLGGLRTEVTGLGSLGANILVHTGHSINGSTYDGSPANGSKLRRRALSEHGHSGNEQEKNGFLHVMYCGLCFVLRSFDFIEPYIRGNERHHKFST